MGWEVMVNNTHSGLFKRFGFFCNTSDHAFGPVFYLDGCYDEGEFYTVWSEVNPRMDPRVLHPKELWDAILRMKEYFGEDMEDYQ